MRFIFAVVLVAMSAFVARDIWYVVSQWDQFLLRDIIKHAIFVIVTICMVVFNSWLIFHKEQSKKDLIKLLVAFSMEVFIVGIFAEFVTLFWRIPTWDERPSLDILFRITLLMALPIILFGLLRWSWHISKHD
jgi:hypothetical protein